jgi:hypothetical protein
MNENLEGRLVAAAVMCDKLWQPNARKAIVEAVAEIKRLEAEVAGLRAQKPTEEPTV